MTKTNRLFLTIGMVSVSVLLTSAAVADAQTTPQAPSTPRPAAPTTPQKELGITFPVPELGNCASKEQCFAYCNDSAHLEACIQFGQKHGLMNKEEVERARKFAGGIREGGGPGGCRSADACKNYCQTVSHIDECLQFAKKQGIKDREVAEAEKIQQLLSRGGKMPGGCDSQASCEKYCGDFSHAEECYKFAKEAGITQQARGGGIATGETRAAAGPAPEQYEKFLALVKEGKTPGGCASREACEAYCGAPDHLRECLEWGTKAGLIDPSQAEKIQKLQGRGPGGCNSPESCKAYCSEPARQEECFKFAKEHGFVTEAQFRETKEGFVRLKAGLENAPPEVAACLKAVLGASTIEDIQSGKFVPGPEVGEAIRNCFEKFGKRHAPQEAFKNVPPQVLACLKEKLGETFAKLQSGQLEPTPEIADTLRVCFEQMHLEEARSPQRPAAGSAPRGFDDFLRSAPPQVIQCLKEQLGSKLQELQSEGAAPGPEIKEALSACFEKFRPAPPSPLEGMPEAVRACIKEKLGGTAYEKWLQRGEFDPKMKEVLHPCFEMQGVLPPPPEKNMGQPPRPPGHDLGQLPPEVQSCLKNLLNPEEWRKLAEGRTVPESFGPLVKQCFEKMTKPPSPPPPAESRAPLPLGSGVPPSPASPLPTGQPGSRPLPLTSPDGFPVPHSPLPTGLPPSEPFPSFSPPLPGTSSSPLPPREPFRSPFPLPTGFTPPPGQIPVPGQTALPTSNPTSPIPINSPRPLSPPPTSQSTIEKFLGNIVSGLSKFLGR